MTLLSPLGAEKHLQSIDCKENHVKNFSHDCKEANLMRFPQISLKD